MATLARVNGEQTHRAQHKVIRGKDCRLRVRDCLRELDGSVVDGLQVLLRDSDHAALSSEEVFRKVNLLRRTSRPKEASAYPNLRLGVCLQDELRDDAL